MSIKIVMNNKNKFTVEGTLEEWIAKIKSEQLLEVCTNTFINSNNISEVYEEIKKENLKKKSKNQKA